MKEILFNEHSFPAESRFVCVPDFSYVMYLCYMDIVIIALVVKRPIAKYLLASRQRHASNRYDVLS